MTVGLVRYGGLLVLIGFQGLSPPNAPYGDGDRTLNHLKTLVREIEADIYQDFKQDALNRIGNRDEKDWPIVALALAFNCPIWTEDQDFFGIGIATWRTKNIEIFLQK